MGWFCRSRMGSLIAGLGLAAAIPASAEPSLDLWRASKIDLNFSKQFLNDDKCDSNAAYRESCLRALNALEMKLGKPLSHDTRDFESHLSALIKDAPKTDTSFLLGLVINAHLRSFDKQASLLPESTTAIEGETIVDPPLLLPGQPAVALIRIEDFVRNRTCDDLKREVLSLHGVNFLILDLRGNLGGDLDAAICAAGLFIRNHRRVVATKDVGVKIPERNLLGPFPQSKKILWRPLGAVADAIYHGELAVLINGATASASEALAGALLVQKRAWLVGERSFGKDSVQTKALLSAIPNSDPKVRLALSATTANFYLANTDMARTQDLGLEPSFEVPTVPGSPVPPPGPHPWLDPRHACIDEVKTLVRVAPHGDYQRDYAAAVLRSLSSAKAEECHHH